MRKFFVKNKTRVSAICAVSLIGLLLFVPSVTSGIKNISLKILSVPLGLCAQAGRYFYSKRVLLEENIKLQKQIGDLSLEIDQLKELRNENDRLRDLLDFEDRIGFDTVSAEIIARNPSDWIGSFVINKGSSNGIRKNSAVCSAKGLLGRVVEIGKDTSSVIAVTHPGFKAGGILKDTRINGIVVGAGKGMARILYLPIDLEVKPGEVVVTSGFSRIFPKGITIGEIVLVKKSKTGLYKYAFIKPSANSFDQEEVLCIK